MRRFFDSKFYLAKMQTICWFIWSQFIDETVLRTSHEEEDNNAITIQNVSFHEAELNQDFPKEDQHLVPDITLDDDELEALVSNNNRHAHTKKNSFSYLFILVNNLVCSILVRCTTQSIQWLCET